MKKYARLKVLLILICVFVVALLFFLFPQKVYAYNSTNMPTDENVIGNLFDEKKGFSQANLNALAKKLDYKDMKTMANAAASGTVHNAADFGQTVVKFGKDNNGEDLLWIPVYVSNAQLKGGNGSTTTVGILTLWLAGTDSKNSDNKQQEVGQFVVDSTYNANVNTIPYSNNYSTSYMRAYFLNNGGTHYGKYGNTANKVTPTPYEYTATSDGTNKFEMYTTGALQDYIVKPENVAWQSEANFFKNDPKWGGNLNYSAEWLNDNLWLPSIYEVFDSSKGENSSATSFKRNGGLWNVSVEQSSNSTSNGTALRTGVMDARYRYYGLGPGGSGTNVDGFRAVRPALHLNISAGSSHTHHLVAHAATEPTCTEKGHDLYYSCTGCGYLFADAEAEQEIDGIIYEDALGHQYSEEFTVDKEPTCTTVGSKSKYCTREGCDAHTEITEIPLADHTPETVAGKPPTCTEKGLTDGSKCSVCGKVLTEQEEIEASGHKWGEWSQTRAPTEETEGEQQRECGVCHEKETKPVPTLDHTHKFSTDWTSDENNHWHASICGHDDIDGEAAHEWDDGKVTKEATCTEEGEKTYTCTVCKHTKTETIAKAAHTEEIDEAVEATCATAGKTAGKHCSVCNEVLEEQKEVPALGHKHETVGGKDPTCTETGLTDGEKCSVCGEVLTAQEEIPALGHSYEWVITKPATKEEAGLMQNKCAVCGDVDGEEEIAKLEDPNGGGEIDLPIDINVEFKVTQSSTDNDYSELDGLKFGYWAQLWYRNEDGTLGDEFTDEINCFLTLKIPTEIIEAIRGGEEINPERIAEELKVYYIGIDGLPVPVESFDIAMREDESWQVKFNYNAKFRAEVVFNAPNAVENSEPAAGIPWWVWLIVGLAGAAVVGVVIVIIVVAKKKSAALTTDNGEVLGRLDKQDEKLNEIREIVDGGFNDIVDDE